MSNQNPVPLGTTSHKTLKHNNQSGFKRFCIATVWLWLAIFAFIPLAITFVTSLLTHDHTHLVLPQFTLVNYAKLANSGYLKIFVESIYLASSCTILCLIMAYPFSFIIARSKSRYKSILLLLVIIPFWTSSLIRTYAIMAILKAKGLLNFVLLSLGIIHQPLQILYSYTAILIGCVYDFLPFMILPLYANIEKLNQEYIEASQDLGATKITTFTKVIIPLTMPGIIAGSVMVFLPSMTMFYIPVILGGAKNLMLGNLIENQFLSVNNWPGGSAMSIVITFIMCLFLIFYWRSNNKNADKNDKQRDFLA